MKISIITPSYAPDYKRCKLLCESIESILPKWLKKIPFSKKWWFSFKTLPVRGWILQQIVKLSVHEYVDADAYIFADSDVSFIRPFDASSVIRKNHVRLCSLPRKDEDYLDKRKQNWHLHAARLFALSNTDRLNRDYISQLVCWRRDTLQKMTQAIEANSQNTKGKCWKQILCNTLDFSEYTLYGIYAEQLLGKESGHYQDSSELCYCSWHKEINNEEELQFFLSNIPKEFNSVLIQSNLGVDTDKYIKQLKRVQISN